MTNAVFDGVCRLIAHTVFYQAVLFGFFFRPEQSRIMVDAIDDKSRRRRGVISLMTILSELFIVCRFVSGTRSGHRAENGRPTEAKPILDHQYTAYYHHNVPR